MADPIGLLDILAIPLEPEVELIRQLYYGDNPKWLVSPEEAASLAAKGLRDYNVLAELAKRGGIGADQFGLKVDGSKMWLPSGDVMASLFRGFIDEETADTFIARTAIAPEQAELVKKLALFLPSPQDVIRFFQRDAFIPEFVERFGMDLEQPADARPWFSKLGITEEVQTLFWRAHWELPSVSQGYEMLWRGQIEKDDLLRLMRAQGVEPYWREKLINVAYSPLRLVDIRRFFKDKVLSYEEMVEQFRFRGYSEENAKRSADWTVKWAAGETAAAKKDLTDGIRSAVIHDVLSGKENFHDAAFLLKDLGLEDATVDHYFSLAQRVEDARIDEKVIQLHGQLYVRGHEDKETVIASMREHGLTDAQITRAFSEWELERKLRTPAEHELKQRELTTAEVTTAYTDDLITKDEATAQLVALRHPQKDAEKIVALAEYKKVSTLKKEKISAVEALVMAGKLGEAEASQELDKIPVRASQRDTLIAKWFRTKRAKAFVLPLGTIEALFVKGIRDEEVTHESLLGHGMTSDDARDVLALWGGKKADAAVRAEKAKKKG